MNAAVRSFVRNSIYRGDKVLAIHDGIEGFINGNIQPIDWCVSNCFWLLHFERIVIFFLSFRADVTGWVAQGGAFLGTKRTLPGNKAGEIAARIKEFKIQGLLIIGGFEVIFIEFQR